MEFVLGCCGDMNLFEALEFWLDRSSLVVQVEVRTTAMLVALLRQRSVLSETKGLTNRVQQSLGKDSVMARVLQRSMMLS